MTRYTSPAPLRAPLDGGAAAANLPVWDLSDLYKAPDDPVLTRDLDRAEADARAFSAKLAGRLGAISGNELAAAIAEYEAIEEVLGRVMSYAQLVFSGDAEDPANGRFYQTMQERATTISSHLIFFTLELNRLEDAVLDRKCADSAALARFRPWLRDLRVFRPHQLSDEVEK
ncbi:MAG: oligoendopeptidase F, partial [Alphaproteobacteria bacterium]